MKTLLSLLAMVGLAATAFADTDPNFIDLTSLDASALATENGASVTVDKEGIHLAFPMSKSYPGFDLAAPGGAWDLSGFRGVAVEIANDGGAKVGVSVRVENPGDWTQSPWNAQTSWINAGAAGTVTVIFGESFGKPGFALDPATVKKIKIFVNTPAEEGTITIRSVRAVNAKP